MGLADLHFEEDRDQPALVGISQKDVKYYVYHGDDSTLWQVAIEKGNLPDKLKGLYTSKSAAVKALTDYLEYDQKELNTSKNRADKPDGQRRKSLKDGEGK